MNPHSIQIPLPHAAFKFAVAFCLLLSGAALHAAPPDLTAGGVPDNSRTTNLGPTGMRGWVYHVNSGGRRADTSEARQIQVTSVANGSPAAGILDANDVILGANGTGAAATNFTYDARKELADAINAAEARNPATLSLLRWRAGTTTTVTITLQTMGAYSTTAPYNCPKSALILQQGLAAIMSGETTGRYSFGTLTLLAANNPADPANAARLTRAQNEARALIPTAAVMQQMMSEVRDTASTWQRGHTLVVLAEYYLATGDAEVLPAIEAYAVNIARNSSLFGTMGHIYAEKNPDGSDNGPMGGVYGPVNNAGMPCYLGLILARECGITHPTVAPMIERMNTFYGGYIGKGTIPYGEHEPAWDGHENNGKSGLAALAYTLQNDRVDEGKYYAQMATAAAADRELGHTGAFFNYLWAPLGAACGGEEAAASHFSRIRWMLDLNRRWDHRFDYDCLNAEGPNSGSQYNDFRMSTAALLTYALPLRQLRITGKNHNPSRWLTSTDVAEAAAADGYKATTSLSISQLISDLASWSPCVQRRAAEQLATRSYDTSTLNQLTALANDPNGNSRYGACLAIGKNSNSATANARAATLAALLTDPENRIRYMAAEAMRYLPQTAKMTQLNTVLSAAVTNARPLFPFDEEDPLHFDHGRIAMLLFYGGNAYGPKGMIWNNLTGVDRNLLYPAIRAVAANPVGQARSCLSQAYLQLTAADVNALAGTIVDSVQFRAPSDKMFSGGIRKGGIETLEKYNIAEGVPLCLRYAVDHLPSNDGYVHGLAVLKKYAGGCTTVTPDPDVIGFCESLLGGSNAAAAQEVLNAIAADPNPAPLTPFKSIQSTTADAAFINLPANQTTLRVTSSDLAQGDSIYTWRKVHGAGNVTFTPNGTAAAKNSVVQFDNVPGKYLFEVTMSDSRGLTEVYKTVAVTLRNPDGTLPPNNPPTAYPQVLSTNPATVKPITLTGVDPEGYPLIFSITSQPAHGVISGSVPDLSYTSDSGYLGPDSFTFQVMDSEGQVSSATININVSAAGIELYAYDGFDYPLGSNILTPLNGGTGFASAWARAQEGANDSITVTTGPPGTGTTNAAVATPGNLDGVFNNPAVTTGPPGSANQYIDGAGGDDRITALRRLSQSAGALAGADKTLWASVIWTVSSNDFGRHVGFTLGTDGLSNRCQNVSTNTTWGGSGAGVAIGVGGGINNSSQVTPAIWSGGNVVARTTTGARALSNTQDNIVILKFEFADGAALDTVQAWAFSENETITEAIFDSNAISAQAVVNQDALNILSFSQSQHVREAIDEIRVGNSFAAVIGVQGTPPDTTPPTLTDISDDRGGETMQQGMPVSYTLNFSEAMDVSTITASDFGNAGTSAIQINSVIQSVPGVVTVNVTPVTPGTLQFQVLQGAVLNDLAGNPLNTATAVTDATIITVNPAMTNVPYVVGMSQSEAESEIATAGLSVGVVNTQNHATIPPGEVIGQNPAGGANAAVGSAVDLVVSIGPAMTTVPNVIGLDQATAESNIASAALAVGTVTTQHHTTVPAGSVISQNPTGGANVVVGSSVDLVVSLGPVMVTVPNVTGLAQASAESNITAANLTVGSVTTENHATVPAGSVISQNPAGGASVVVGSSVGLVVSLGPVMVSVPNVNGLAQATAESNITAANLTVGAVTTENHATVPAGSVISQNPTGGASVADGSAVNLVVSLGPVMVSVPNVNGLAQATAESNITAANLTVGTVTSQNHATIPAGVVISQNPTGGASVAEGSAVNLVVSLGPLNVSNHAIADIPVSGTVVGTYQDSHSSNNIYQALSEIESTAGAQKNRYSYLEHIWQFNVTGGDAVTFHVEAHHTVNNESDDFIFAYSTNGVNGTWQNMFMVTKTTDNNTVQTFVLPPGTSGTVHVRVLDTNRGRGRRSLDTLFIDEMFILNQTGATGGAPVPDEVVWVASFPGVDLSDPAADFDGDGLSNGEERIWGLDPTSAASCNPYAGTFDRNAGTFRYTRRDRALTGLTYSVWTSADMVDWTEDTAAGQLPGEPNDKGVLTEEVTVSPELLANPSLFIQIRAAE